MDGIPFGVRKWGRGAAAESASSRRNEKEKKVEGGGEENEREALYFPPPPFHDRSSEEEKGEEASGRRHRNWSRKGLMGSKKNGTSRDRGREGKRLQTVTLYKEEEAFGFFSGVAAATNLFHLFQHISLLLLLLLLRRRLWILLFLFYNGHSRHLLSFPLSSLSHLLSLFLAQRREEEAQHTFAASSPRRLNSRFRLANLNPTRGERRRQL